MKKLSDPKKIKIAGLLGGILFVSTSLTFPDSEILTKRHDTVAYHEALHELRVNMLRDNVLNANIDEQLKVFDKLLIRKSQLNSNGKRNVKSKIPAPIERKNGWYFMFDK